MSDLIQRFGIAENDNLKSVFPTQTLSCYLKLIPVVFKGDI